MSILIIIFGAVLILAGVRDIFRELFDPAGSGSLSRMSVHVVWWVFKVLGRVFPWSPRLAGPISLVVVILSWAMTIVLGFSLIYWSYMPEHFTFADGIDPRSQGNFADAFYFSFVTLTTLGFGDITPINESLRILTGLQGLIGFAVLSASITWVLSLYPIITRLGVLANEIKLQYEAEEELGIGIEVMEESSAVNVLSNFTSQLVEASSGLRQFEIAYYFHEPDELKSLPANMPRLKDIATRAVGSNVPAIKIEGVRLKRAIDDFAQVLRGQFLSVVSERTDEILKAYARDHEHGMRSHRAASKAK